MGLALLALLTGCAAEPTRLTMQVDPRGTAESVADPVTLRYVDEAAVLTVQHRRGAGRVLIVRTAGRWPKRIELHFVRFSRLEGLELSAYDVRGRLLATATLDRGLIAEPAPAGAAAATRRVLVPDWVTPGRAARLAVQWVDVYRR